MSDLTDGLNDEQAQAVLSESKRLLVMAGAGSGKTRVLTRRIANLNLNHRVGTSSIVAITFTRAAAKEMKERLGHLIGEKEAKKMICCTFHALAVRILKEWGQRIGLDKQFTIYDQEDREEVVGAILKTLGLSNQTSVSKVLEQMSRANPREPEASVLREYAWQLKRFNAVDLDHLIRKVNELFIRYPDVADYYRRQWKCLFADEYQDTDTEQFQFIKLLNPENLFAVGDWRQAVYGWRGARVQNILEFKETYPEAEVIELNRNYRSTRQIVEAANSLISHSEIKMGGELIAEREGAPIDYFFLSDQESEANISSGLIEQKEFDGKFSDYAVLARTNAQIDSIYFKLRSKGIPVMMLGGSDDPLKKHDIRYLISYLISIFNPRDEKNFKRAINFPEPMMTDIKLKRLEQIATERSISLRQALAEGEGFSDQFHLYESISDGVLQQETALGALWRLVESLNLRKWYAERSLHNRIHDLDEAEQYISFWMERQQKLGEDIDAPAFLKWVATRDIQEKLMDDRDAVKLMTIHGSKGLEFPTVFLIGMNEGAFPSKNTRDMEEERRLAYVAVTRAKTNLIISSTRTTSSWGQTVECEPSRFIEELGGVVDILRH